MDFEQRQMRRQARRRALRRRRLMTAAAIVAVAAAVILAVALAGHKDSGQEAASTVSSRTINRRSTRRTPTRATQPISTGRPGNRRVPILMYHVINPPPAGAPFPGLYVSREEFTAQVRALAHAGYHAVTMDQIRSYWLHGTPLPAGQPIVLSFDNGYQSQYTQALPVLRELGWVGVENIQLSGLPPSQGGLTQSQIRGLVSAGWELDTQGYDHADLITLNAADLRFQIARTRRVIQDRYRVPVNWFCYPSGHYDPTVIAAVKAAGYVGSTTVVPGWSSRTEDPYALPRLRVLGGTSPSALLEQIATARSAGPPPASYGSG